MTTPNDARTDIATTILQQLGGAQFLVITGSKNPLADGNTLHLQLAKNQSGANRLSITLTGMDDYNMRFYYYRPPHCRVNKALNKVADFPEVIREISLHEGVFWDQLQDVFEEVTGLYTTLFPRR